MRQRSRRCGSLLILVSFLGVSAAQAQLPPLSGRVVDQAELLDPEVEQRVDAILADHERRTGNQVVVLSVPSLGGRSVEAYALEVARAWGLGSEEADDGVLFLVAAEERKLRIEVGRGLEDRLTDARCSRILREEVRPLLAEDRTGEGVLAGVRALVEALDGRPPEDNELEPSSPSTPAGSAIDDLSPFGRVMFLSVLVAGLVLGGWITVIASGGFRWIPLFFPILPFAAALGQQLAEAPLLFPIAYLMLWSFAVYFFNWRARGRMLRDGLGRWFFGLLPAGGGGGSASSGSWNRDDTDHLSSSSSSSSYSGGGGDFAGGGASEDY